MTKKIEAGAAAGLIGGVVAAALLHLTHMTTPDGRQPAIQLAAAAVHTVHVPVAWLAVLVYSAAIGGLFGWLLSRQRIGEGAALVWGGLYGASWWIVSGLVVIPALQGVGPMSPAAVDLIRPAALPWFAAMILDGIVLGGTFAVIDRRWRRPASGVAAAPTRRAA